MRDRPATSVSFYQRATPMNGPPVVGKNGITEDMITSWKCGCSDHISLLFPKADNKGLQGIQFMFTQGEYTQFAGQFTHPSWILIDTA